MKIVRVKWLDAWMENELTVEEIQNRENKVHCQTYGYFIWEDDELVAVAAEKVDNIDESVSFRAITFIPKSLIIETKVIGG